jgi:hypothetical protein
MPREIYHLKVTLDGVVPPVWRRLLVPGGFTLDRVSRAIQLAFGWRGHHLHSFEAGGRQYGAPGPLDEDDGDIADELDLRDELDVRLDGIAAAGDRFMYVYDFGDWWEHEVVVERVTPAEAGERYPVCAAGERSGPLEDIGGPAGYAELLAVFGDPGRPDPSGLREWLGAFDPDRCEPAGLTALLRRMT